MTDWNETTCFFVSSANLETSPLRVGIFFDSSSAAALLTPSTNRVGPNYLYNQRKYLVETDVCHQRTREVDMVSALYPLLLITRK